MRPAAVPLLWVGAERVRLCTGPQAGQSLPFAGSDALRAAVATLAGHATRWRGVDVVVSDAHCRYLSVPRAIGLRGRAELEASHAARFASVFGEPAGGWLLRHDGPLLGERDLVCALRGEVALAVQAGLREARRRLAHLRPLWVRCSQQARAPRGPHWLAAHDGHSFALGLFDGAQCLAVRATRLGGADAATVLAREIALQPAHTPGTPVWLYGPGSGPARLDDGSPVRTLPLPVLLEGGA